MKIKKVHKINLSVLLLMSCSFASADNPFRPKERVVNNVQNSNIDQNFEPDYFNDPYMNNFDFNQNNNQFDFMEEELEVESEKIILTPEELWEEYKVDLIFIGTLNGERVYRDFDYNYIYKNEMFKIYEREYKKKLEALNKNSNGEEQ